MYDFIWDSKPAKIKRDVLTMDYEKGGGGKNDRSRNVYEIFKICWIKRIKRMIAFEDDGLLKKPISKQT